MSKIAFTTLCEVCSLDFCVLAGCFWRDYKPSEVKAIPNSSLKMLYYLINYLLFTKCVI